MSGTAAMPPFTEQYINRKDMKSYRIGNDIHFEWTIRGLEEVTGTKVVQLYHANRSVPEEITYTISGNVATGVYRGKHQTEKGAYRLLLQVNNGADGMVTLDKVNAWALFGVCAFGIVAGEDDDAIQTVSVELESDLRTGTAPSGSVQADWDETDPDDPAYIKHKPTIPDAQIQSDFNQTNTSAKDFIKNKPNMAAIQQWLALTVCGGAYNSTLKRLEFKDKDNTLLFTIDATAFIKDGMVTNVEISNGNLVITFNTDSGQEPISIPITNIFNPNNYYTKNDIDLTFATIASIADMATKTWVNNQGFLTSAPVTSVNGQTGAVSLSIPDVSGKAEKSEMGVVDGTGTDSDKTTITLKTGTSATVLKSHQDISGKEDVTQIVAQSTAVSTLTAEVGKYYRFDVAVETLAITLPTMTGVTNVKTITFYMTGGTTPGVTFTSTHNVYLADFTIESGKTYEVNAAWNGASWIVAAVNIIIPSV